ncbi:MAG: carboxypeptidase regulatory-like domain-containing protein [Balneolaceae bacterium]|nr:MAG: carboxypeptidase regulatory-like domain-containing protein [Balneolaceae bacterium]
MPGIRFSALFLLLVLLVSCEKDAIDKETFGSIEGFVLNSQTDEPVYNANITTTPPTNSILTNSDGTFYFDDIPSGSYSIQARKSGFKSNSVSVTVRIDGVAHASIPLSPEPDDIDDGDDDENGNEGD